MSNLWKCPAALAQVALATLAMHGRVPVLMIRQVDGDGHSGNTGSMVYKAVGNISAKTKIF